MNFVNYLLSFNDNIIDQLKTLKKFKNNPEVQIYMMDFLCEKHSPYITYCVDKYYFDLDVSEVPEEIPNHQLMYSPAEGLAKSILDSEDNIINQLKKLKENSDDEDVKNHIEWINSRNLKPYDRYCLDKYYFGLDVPEVEPPKWRLYPYYPYEYEQVEAKVWKRKRKELISVYKKQNLKKGDYVKGFSSKYGEITGTLQSINYKTGIVTIKVDLFGKFCDFEVDGIVRIVPSERINK